MITLDPQQAAARRRVIEAGLAMTLAAMLVFLQLSVSDWRTACFLFLSKDILYLLYALRSGDRWMQRMFLFLALLTAWNLAEDWLLVDQLRAIEYQLAESRPPTLWHTPAFGLLAWPAMTMELAFLGAWLVQRLGWLGIGACCALGMIMIPGYDELALRLHWWRYGHARLFLHTPYFVIVAEGLLAGAIGWASYQLQRRRWWWALLAGALTGVYLLVTTWVSYLLLS